MVRQMLLRMFALLLAINLAAPAVRAAVTPPSPLQQRAAELVSLFNGQGDPDTFFAPSFLAQVPAAQMRTIATQMVAQFGAAKGIAKIDATNATAGTVFVDFEKATVQLTLAIEPAPPNRVTGLLITGSEVKGDSLVAVSHEIWGLPGEASLAVARLDGSAAPVFSISHKAEQPLAVGSAFKLFLLAELSRSIEAGERKWSDVIVLDRRSLPSGILQSWPEGSPLTLHTLAALMISQSDNSATDILLAALGREKVEAMMTTIGVTAPQRNRPLLATREMFVLKGGDQAFMEQWLAGNEAQRRALLAGPVRSFPSAQIDTARLATAPNAIDSVEWFFSTSDLVRAMNWLRLHADRQALEILAINPGIGPAAAGEFAYLGYKGGSEPGVINMTFLLRGKNGDWHAVSGTWNNKTAPVDEAKFVLLMSRAVALLR
jgi:hypothetical protein